MKKMMIAACAVALAAVAHAATYNWSVGTTTASYNGYDSTAGIGKVWTSAKATSMAYYLIDASAYTQANLLTAMRAGSDWSSAVLASGTTTSEGLIANKTFSTTDTTTLTAYVVLINDAETYAYLGTSVTKTGDSSGGQVDFSPTITTSKVLRDTAGTTAYSSAGWYSTAVPEPTSGLLLLLGMAGLALKRKIA